MPRTESGSGIGNSPNLSEYKGVKYSVGATSQGVAGKWSGEYAIYNKESIRVSEYILVPGEFNSEGEACAAADKHIKELIDDGTIAS